MLPLISGRYSPSYVADQTLDGAWPEADSYDGMVLIFPQSVNLAGSRAWGFYRTENDKFTGSFEFGFCTEVSVNGVFSSRFSDYFISIQHTVSTGLTTYIRFRSNGVNNSVASSYWAQDLFANGSTVSGSRGNDIAGYGTFMTGNNVFTNGSAHYIYGPFKTQNTSWRTIQVNDLSNARTVDIAGTHTVASSFDGFSLLPFGGGTISGTISVYGMVG